MNTLIIIKKTTFFSQNIKISINNINFNNKKIKKSDFYNKNKKIFNIDDMDVNKIKYQSLKKKHTTNIIYLNTLLGIMITALLDHYIYLFYKRLAILINLIKIK